MGFLLGESFGDWCCGKGIGRGICIYYIVYLIYPGLRNESCFNESKRE